MASRQGKIALYIDGPDFHATGKALGFQVDFKKLLAEFEKLGTIVRAFYYSAVAEEGDFVSVRPLLDWLDYNGYNVVTKPSKEFIDAAGRRKVKNNMDVELAINAMQLTDHVDQIVLFSGDSAFRCLIAALQRRGVRVTVVSSLASDPPLVASKLRRQADDFIDLKNLRSKIQRS